MIKVGREIWEDPELKEEYINNMMWSQDVFRERYNDLPYEELPDYVRTGMETRPRKGVIIKTLRIRSKHWDKDDYYNVIPEFQIMGEFEPGDEVKITVELIHKMSDKEDKEQ